MYTFKCVLAIMECKRFYELIKFSWFYIFYFDEFYNIKLKDLKAVTFVCIVRLIWKYIISKLELSSF